VKQQNVGINFYNVNIKLEMINTEELIDALDNDATEADLKFAAESLLEAISDWPTSLSEPSELVSELKLQINAKLTVKNIERFLKALRVEKDSWKMESLSSILNIFEIDRNENVDGEVELEVLLERITNRLKS